MVQCQRGPFMSPSAYFHHYYSSGNHTSSRDFRSKSSGSKMSERMMEGKLGVRRVISSFGNLAGQGEGIYASSTSVDVALQQAGQIGLTRSPKTTPSAKPSLEACVITDQDFEDALMQPKPVSAKSKGSTLSFSTDTTLDFYQRNVCSPGKTRKLSKDLYKPLLQELSSSLAVWDNSTSSGMVSVEPLNFFAENIKTNDLYDDSYAKSLELPRQATESSQQTFRACHEQVGNAYPSIHERTESIGKSGPESVALRQIRQAHSSNYGLSTPVSDRESPEVNVRGEATGVQYDQAYDTSTCGIVHRVSLDIISSHPGNGFGRIGLPKESTTEDERRVDYFTDTCRPGSMDFDEAKSWSASDWFRFESSQPTAGVRSITANQRARNRDASQDTAQNSLPSPRTLSQTSTIASIAKLFQLNSQEALFEAYSRSLSTRHIPPEQRKRFDALLRKYQRDEQFRGAVAAYAMDLSGVVTPGGNDPVVLEPRLRAALKKIYDKCQAEQDFRMNVEQYVIEFLRCQTPFKEVSPQVNETDEGKLHEGYKRKDLDGLSVAQITKYCRELESSRAEHVRDTRRYRELYNRLALRFDGTPRVRHQPKGPKPKLGNWTCFHMKQNSNKNQHCGRSNPYYEKKHIWKQITHCKACTGVYEEDFELLKQLTTKKTSPGKNQNANQVATPDVSQSPSVTEANSPAYTRANAFDASIIGQDLMSWPSSDGNHRQRGGNIRIDTEHLSPGYHSSFNETRHTTLSGGLHSSNKGLRISGLDDSTTYSSPGHSSGHQESLTAQMDTLNHNMDLSEQEDDFTDSDIEFDPDTMMDIESFLNNTGNYFDEDNPSQNFSRLEDNTEKFGNHYPAQVNLFAQQTDSGLRAPASVSAYRSPYDSIESLDEAPAGSMSSVPASNAMVQKKSRATPRNGRGQGWSKLSSTNGKKKYPIKKPRASRSKAAIAERAAANALEFKSRELTQEQMDRIQAGNNASAIFLSRRRKNWEPPHPQYPPRIVIDIPDDAEGSEENDNMAREDAVESEAAQPTQGIDFEQNGSLLVYNTSTAEFYGQDHPMAKDIGSDHNDNLLGDETSIAILSNKDHMATEDIDSDHNEDLFGDLMSTDEFNAEFSLQDQAVAKEDFHDQNDNLPEDNIGTIVRPNHTVAQNVDSVQEENESSEHVLIDEFTAQSDRQDQLAVGDEDAGQEESKSVDDMLTNEFNAEFDRQDEMTTQDVESVQDTNSAGDDMLADEFNAEFDRQDRATALAAEESEVSEEE